MNEQERLKLREEIAQGINHGLNNLEIYGQLNGKNFVSPSDLIGVIRDMMEEQHTATQGVKHESR